MIDEELPDFEERYYLELYPDVAASGMDAYEHFLYFGIAEGRLGAPPRLRTFAGSHTFDPARQTVLVVSHEASLTGAPILSLNLIRELQHTYNVVSLLLGGGPLVKDFQAACVLSVEPRGRRHHAELASKTIAELTDLYRCEFALVNSVECSLTLEPLARAGVPSLALIHEFAAYTRPFLLFQEAFQWATEVVFSTRVTYEDVVATVPQLVQRACRFIPQGRCTLLSHQLPPEQEARELERVHGALRPLADPEGTIVVIGIGSVHIRKGVELFIDCAAQTLGRANGRNFRFVWVGDGLDAENDIGYSTYLMDQIRRSGLSANFEFMRTTALVETVYELADIFLLTSRLDPLPGVAIEAMSHGLPVLCFQDTTGIADVLIDYGMGPSCVMPFLDTAAMARAVLELAADDSTRLDVGRRLAMVAARHFDMAGYVNSLEGLAAQHRPEALSRQAK